jgi:hypothetical protein
MFWKRYHLRLVWSALAGAVIGLVALASFILLANVRLDSDFLYWLPMALVCSVLSFALGSLLLFGLFPIGLGWLVGVLHGVSRRIAWSNIAKPLITFVLCMPLFFVCIIGDTRDNLPSQSNIALFELFFAPLLFFIFFPALVVQAASGSPRIQNILFILFLAIFAAEVVIGITPTSQLNHEGTDILWFVVHVAYALSAVIIYGVVSVISRICRLGRRDE